MEMDLLTTEWIFMWTWTFQFHALFYLFHFILGLFVPNSFEHLNECLRKCLMSTTHTYTRLSICFCWWTKGIFDKIKNWRKKKDNSFKALKMFWTLFSCMLNAECWIPKIRALIEITSTTCLWKMIIIVYRWMHIQQYVRPRIMYLYWL